jgi:hypothetical protein
MMPRSMHDQEVAWLMRQRVNEDMIGECGRPRGLRVTRRADDSKRVVCG